MKKQTNRHLAQRIDALTVAIVLSFIALTLVGGWVWEARKIGNPWRLVPPQTLAVLSFQQLPEWLATHENLAQHPLSPALQKLTNFPDIAHWTDSLAQLAPEWAEIHQQHPLLLSFHTIAGDRLAWVAYVPVASMWQPATALADPLTLLDAAAGWQVSQRPFQGLSLFEARSPGNRHGFAFFRWKNYWVIGQETALVEQAARQTAFPWLHSGFEPAQASSSNPQPSVGILLQMKPLRQYLAAVGLPTPPMLHDAETESAFFLFEQKTKEQTHLWQLSAVSGSDWPLTDWLTNPADSSEAWQVIPQRAAYCYGIGIGPKSLNAWENRWLSALPETETTAYEALTDTVGWDREDWWEVLDQEIVWAGVAPREGGPLQPLLLLHSPDPQRLVSYLRAANPVQNLSLPQGFFHSDIPHLSKWLFGAPFDFAGRSYFTTQGSWLAWSNSLQAVADWQADLVSGQTLAKAPVPAPNGWLSATWIPRNGWEAFNETLSEGLRASLQKEEFNLLKTNYLQINISPDRQNPVWEISWQSDAQQVADLPPPTKPVKLPEAVIQGPFPIQNGGQMLFVGGQRLYAYGMDGRLAWSHDLLATPLLPPARYQRDQQLGGMLVWGHGNQVTVMQENGQVVRPFPLTLPPYIPIKHVQPVGGESAPTQFLIADELGNLYLTSQWGTPQPKWDPRPIGWPVAAPPVQLDLEGQWAVLALTSEGGLHLLGKDARPLHQFPLLLNAPCSNPMAVEWNASPETSRIHVLTDGGEWVQVDLLGRIQGRTQLDRLSAASRFLLCNDVGGQRDWCMARQDGALLTVIDQQGQDLFEVTLPNNQPVQVRYWKLHRFFDVVEVFSPDRKKVHLYDRNGKSLYRGGIDATAPLWIEYHPNSQSLTLHRILGRDWQRIFLSIGISV